jgi:Putative DNA-binding domain
LEGTIERGHWREATPTSPLLRLVATCNAVTPSPENHLKRARAAKRESKWLDFKEGFDPSSEAEWCELLKDLLAMANSGGGVVVVGVKNNGKASGVSVKPVLRLDLAHISDKVLRYTGEHFAGIHIHEIKRSKTTVAALVIDSAPVPLVPIRRAPTRSQPKMESPRRNSRFDRGSSTFATGPKASRRLRPISPK